MRAKTFFQRALCAAFTSRLGTGGAAYRSEGAEGPVDTVFLGAFRRDVFERVGLFDPRAVTNEDAELNQRIIDSGGKVYLSPAIVVGYYPRESLSALTRQYFAYGQGRARTLLKHGGLLSGDPPFLSWLCAALRSLWRRTLSTTSRPSRSSPTELPRPSKPYELGAGPDLVRFPSYGRSSRCSTSRTAWASGLAS